jgi:V/A-type H+-transporting ATPase subunit E
MSGLDKIVEEIHRQAETESGEILKKADEYCDTYMQEVKKEISEEISEYHKKAREERELYEAKTKSGMEFQERNSILKAKQQCIQECLCKAQKQIDNFSDEEYFKLLEKILKANIQKGSGVMKLSKRDLERMPEEFKSITKNLAEQAGGELEISTEPAPIFNGFVLVYGDIEENCTIKALFDANEERLKDLANQKLFCRK